MSDDVTSTDQQADLPPYGLLVLGSGPAGVHAAASYAAAGGPGRVCVVSEDVDQPYERPPLSKDVLAGEEPPEPTPIIDDELALALVELRLGTRVDAIDLERRVVRTGEGQELAYERLVVATGSEPLELPEVEAGAEVHPLRSLEHARRLVSAADAAGSAVVVGSGFIGCEAAASLAARGVATTLVTTEDSPQQARLGPWVGAQVAGWLTDVGVELRTGSEVAGVGAPAVVRLEDGTVEGDLVLAAVGVAQERDALASSGLALEEGHLVADAQLRTSDPRVWAAGDVARAHHAVADRPLSVEHWGDAMTMGELAGRNSAAYGEDGAGHEPGRWDAAPGFWSTIGEHTLKYAAWGDGHDRAEVVEHGDGAFTVWYAAADGELVGVLTHERDQDYDRGGELLGRRARLAEALGEGSRD